MNYVGCKVFPSQQIVQPYFSFYMNYVGCKESFIFSVARSIISFIWTMWDVK